MALDDYLLPRNAGSQFRQTLATNLFPGDHPWNFEGICQALVSQWFLEVHFAAGRQPDDLGGYLLNNYLGSGAYKALAKAQASKISLRIQSGDTLQLGGIGYNVPLPDEETCTLVILSYITGVDTSHLDGLDEIHEAVNTTGAYDPETFSAQLSLKGANGQLMSKLFGDEWGHAIGIHCDGNATLYVFDPNWGTFTIAITPMMEEVRYFIADLWDYYKPSGPGSRLQIVHP